LISESKQDNAESSYGRVAETKETENSMNKKEISPYRNGDNSFFSSENEISRINFASNKPELHIDNTMDVDVSDMQNEKDINLKIEKARMFKQNLKAENNQKDLALSEEESHNSTQNAYKVSFQLIKFTNL
jgi:hypothetical protein